MKNCAKCNVDRELSEYSNHKTTRDGKQSYCKPCATALSREWVKAHPIRRARHVRKYKLAKLRRERAEKRALKLREYLG